MISSLDIALKIKYRLNKVDTNDDENLPIVNIVEAYNKAQVSVQSRLANKNNIYKTGLESSKERIDDLDILINPEPLTLPITKKNGYYVSDTLPDNYFRHIRITCEASNTKCSSKEMFIYLQEESNLNTLLRNENVNPNFEWAETICTIAGNRIKVFFDDFEIKNLYFTYMRKANNIDIPGYEKEDGSPSTLINPELSDTVIEMCIDEACRILSGDMGNQFSNQISQQNLQMGK